MLWTPLAKKKRKSKSKKGGDLAGVTWEVQFLPARLDGVNFQRWFVVKVRQRKEGVSGVKKIGELVFLRRWIWLLFTLL